MSEKAAGPKHLEEDASRLRERAEERALFVRYKADPSKKNEEVLVERFRPLVYRIVHKFRYPPDQFEDLVQVGTQGLLLAIRRFDTDMNFRFSTYAWQTIQGEIQRYFRDKTWAVNVPRDLKERSLRVFNAMQEINRLTGHEPTVAEVAQFIEMGEEAVQEAMELGSAYHPQSFTPATRESDISFTVAEDATASDSGMAAAKRNIFWDSVLSNLDEFEAIVLRSYFFEDSTQKEIAERLGTSQMNVSRIMRKGLGRLRTMLASADLDDLTTL